MKTRAAILVEPGQPLVLEDALELPDPGRGQVLVKMAFSGICQSQLMEVRGRRGPDRYLPHLLGHEGSGRVVAVGPDVRKVKAGDAIILTWIKGSGIDSGGIQCRRGAETINGGPVTTFSEHTLVSENRCVPLPDGVPMHIAALFGCALPTGAGLVLNEIAPAPGSSLGVWGVGGIGMCAVIGAALCRCSPIVAVDTQPAKLALALELGATHTVNAAEKDAQAAVREIVGEEGLDYAVEAAGRIATIEAAFAAVRPRGGLCVFASHPPAGEKIAIDPHWLISGRQIRGSWGGATDPDRDLPRLARFYREGGMPLERLISHRFPLERVNEAMDMLESGTAGRVLLEIEPSSVNNDHAN